MKFPKNADIEEYKKTLQAGAVKGAGTGLLIGFGAAAFLRRRTSYFHGAGGFQKMLVYAAPSAFCTIVNMELSSRNFEAHMRLKQHGAVPQDAPHKNADLWDRATEFGMKNKYKLIVAGWAASLAGSFYLVNRDKYMSKSQKIVQARVYAQGLTVALLLASVFLSVAPVAKTDKERAVDQSKSWERDIKYVENANHPHGATVEHHKAAEKTDKLFHNKNAERIKDELKPTSSEKANAFQNAGNPPKDGTSENVKQQDKKPEISEENREQLKPGQPETDYPGYPTNPKKEELSEMSHTPEKSERSEDTAK